MASEASDTTENKSRTRSELLLDAEKLSRILLQELEHGSKHRLLSSQEERLLGSIILKCLGFRRVLLDNKPGPKKTLEKEIQDMERDVGQILDRKG